MATVEWRGDELVKAITKGIRKGIGAAAVEVQDAATKLLLNTKGSGRLYRRSRARIHRASAPGETPAKDTGALGRSFQISQPRDNGNTISVRVGPIEVYGAFLELGTSRMAPRPYLRRSVRAAENNIERVFTREVKEAVRRFR